MFLTIAFFTNNLSLRRSDKKVNRKDVALFLPVMKQ